MIINDLSKNSSILNHFVSELRNIEIQHDSMRFRKNLKRIGEIMAYEISKTLCYNSKNIQTPLGISNVMISDDDIVLATILRAGIPFYDGFLNVFDKAQSAFISASRHYNKDHSSFEIVIEYISSPKIDEKTLIIIDPMLATGGSLKGTYESLQTKGSPKSVHIACTIASNYAIEVIKNRFSQINTTLWAAAIDPEINEKAYIIPGLGDAGDLAYGIKE